MLKRSLTSEDPPTVKVTFALPIVDADLPTSVVGDFNGWDPLAHPLKKRSNGTRSVTVEVPAGATLPLQVPGGRWHVVLRPRSGWVRAERVRRGERRPSGVTCRSV